MKWFKKRDIKKRTLSFEKKRKWKDEETYTTIADTILIKKALELISKLDCNLTNVQFQCSWNNECKIEMVSNKEQFLKFVESFIDCFIDSVQDVNFTLE